MKLGIFSDLHLDFGPWDFYPYDYPEVDLWLNAGDTSHSFVMRDGFHRLFKDRNYLHIQGNHDFYNTTVLPAQEYCFKADVAGVKIAGATLWTDLSNPMDWLTYKDGLIDYRYMKNHGWNESTYNEHFQIHKKFLMDSGADIIMSHHAPSYKSVHPRFIGDSYNCCFATELGNDILAMEKPPKLWIHGHMHDASDYMIGETRVICHPRGYPNEGNYKNYKPLIVEI